MRGNYLIWKKDGSEDDISEIIILTENDELEVDLSEKCLNTYDLYFYVPTGWTACILSYILIVDVEIYYEGIL